MHRAASFLICYLVELPGITALACRDSFSLWLENFAGASSDSIETIWTHEGQVSHNPRDSRLNATQEACRDS